MMQTVNVKESSVKALEAAGFPVSLLAHAAKARQTRETKETTKH